MIRPSTTEAWISIISLVLLYAVLMVVELGLIIRVVKKGADQFQEPPDPGRDSDDEDRPLAFAY